MKNRALITGASGFVGTLFCQYLEQREWEVVRGGDLHGENTIHCDMSDAAQVRAMLETAGPLSHVFHLAAMTFVPDANASPAKAMQVNLIGTIHLVEAMRACVPGARLVFIGSAEAYGPPQFLPMEETHPLAPQNPYAISKAAADQYCGFLAKSRQLDVVRMRPFNHSGPGQGDQFVLSSFARQVAEIEAGHSEPVIRVGDLTAARDFSHVQDVLRAYELAALKGRSGEAYNVCSGQARPIQAALDRLLAISSVRVDIVQDPARMRPVDVPRVEGSYQKLEADTGWRPQISFETLLQDLLISWRAAVAKQV